MDISQSRPPPYGPIDYDLLGSSVHGILQARILEWVAISLSKGIFLTPALQVDSEPSEPPVEGTRVCGATKIQRLLSTLSAYEP